MIKPTRYLSPLGWIILGALLFWVVVIFVMVNYAWAAPYLTCDCTPATDQVTSFQLQFGAQPWVDTTATMTCGLGPDRVICLGDSRTVCYDLAVLPTGAFTIKGRASNAWGSSVDSLPFSGVKSVPSSPLLLRKVQ